MGLSEEVHEMVAAERDKVDQRLREMGHDPPVNDVNLMIVTAWLNGLQDAIAHVALKVDEIAAKLEKNA